MTFAKPMVLAAKQGLVEFGGRCLAKPRRFWGGELVRRPFLSVMITFE